MLIFDRLEGDGPSVGRESRLRGLVDRQLDVISAGDSALADVEQKERSGPFGTRKDRHVIAVRREGEIPTLCRGYCQALRHQVLIFGGEPLGEVLIKPPIGKTEDRHVHILLIGRERRHEIA